jgi:hypothetical protein
MIKEKEIEIIGHPRNYLYYKELGYDLEIRKVFSVKVCDLMRGCAINITSICDKCGRETRNAFKDYYTYTNGLIDLFYCNKCKVLKSEETCLNTYGVRNPMQSDKVKNILKESILKKYGVDHYSKTDEYKVKFKNTCLEKYNKGNVFQIDFIKEKIKSNNLEKYGIPYSINETTIRKKSKLSKEQSTKDKYSDMLNEDYSIIKYEDNLFTIDHIKCSNTFLIDKHIFYNRISYNSIICTKCNPVGHQSSSIELELIEFIKDNNLIYIQKDRKKLKGLELDIYIPHLNIALEINGVYWHSELFKNEKYHLNKTNKCKEQGIQLTHIWEDDWKFKRNIIKSIILNKFNLIPNKLYARKCELKEVTDIGLIKSFLNNNHIQGYSPSTTKIGLFYNNELVSLMTFGLRFTNGKGEMELIRFCNKVNLNVIGSASKLFKYYCNNFDYKFITSYSDISMFSGKMYENLGFKYSHDSDPNYFWVVDGIRKHRFNYNKKKLIKMGYDASKSEVKIMHELGHYRIWGCGQKKWVYEK